MSIFDRLDRIVSRTVDRTFANAFTCQPMKATPNGKPIVDPDHAAWEGVGILTETPADVPIDIGARNRSNDFRTVVNGSGVELSVDRERYPRAEEVRQGDQFAIGERTFVVSSVQPDGLSRVVFVLVL